MTTPTVSFVKQYLRIDFTDDDMLIGSLVNFSTAFIENATGYAISSNTSNDFESLCLAMTVAHFYENRQFVTTTGAVPQKVPMTLQALYSQLQRIAEDPSTTTTPNVGVTLIP